MTLPRHLWEIKEQIREIAEELGLDFFETIFEVVDYKRMNAIAAYGGFPTRYPHWRFGMEYEQLSKSYTYGLSKIYEMVINNDPCYAYLLEGNNFVDQKTVIAHVYGHCDFFKNNYYFSKTNRRMIDEMANHATRVRRYIDRFGIEKVESYIDVCLSIDNLIDYHSPFIVRQRERTAEEEEDATTVPKLRSKDYMDKYINPPDFIAEQQKKLDEEHDRARRFPETPLKDIMGFLLEHAPLEGWEADVLSLIREEAYYFAPQGQTKIMNEGWACVAPDTLVFTNAGLISMADLVAGEANAVADGVGVQRVYDRNIIKDCETVTIKTRRGLTLTGSSNHRLRLSDEETWRRMDELSVGESIEVKGGGGLWPTEHAPDQSAEQFVRSSADVSKLERLPNSLLRAPEPLVRRSLRSLFDHNGHVGVEGVLLSVATEALAEQVQLLLLNYQVLSCKGLQRDGRWDVLIDGPSTAGFAEQVGFALESKQDALMTYIRENQFKKESWTDTIVSIETGRGDVYDISVENTHRYAAAGVVNHNSFWHSKIMTEHALTGNEIIDYAEAYAGIVATRPGQFNPYKIGIELFRNIEERWNRGQFGKEWEECESMAAKESWDKKLGLGREKIYQVRAIYNDVTFIDEFLTEDFARAQNLFTFGYNRKARDWQIESKDFKEVKTKLLSQLTNFGHPYIYVKDGNYQNRGELLLHHKFEGVELKLDYARDVLQNIFRIWKRPVNIETMVEGKGRLYSFDGKEHGDKAVEYEALKF